MRFELSGARFDLDARLAERAGRPLRLSERDWQLLEFFARRANQALGRDLLMREVLGYSPSVESRALDAAVSRLRSKIELRPVDPVHLVTVYGYGYRLDLDAAPVAAPEAEVDAVARLCAEHGHVTLVGPAGSGKTHLASLVARALDPNPLLVDLTDPGATWSDRDGVLILDSAERAPDRVIAFLSAPHRARTLVTARERLQWPQEVVHRVAELAPDRAAALFVEQCQRVGVSIRPDERDAVDQIVRKLDGLPLAVRYAATRTLVLRPAELARALDRDLGVLTPSLAAAVSWTWDRLEPWERSAVSQLSVFEGGFLLEAALRVVELDRPLVDVVQALVDRCLCRRVGQGPRFAVYRALREFAADRLTVAAVHRDAVTRWLAWCVAVAEGGGIEDELANLRAARDLAELVDPDTAARLARALG